MNTNEKKKILIVEDDRDIAHTMVKVLERLQYAIAGIVSTGEEAVDKIFELRPDLVIMDVVLKGKMNGIETSRQLEQFMDLPVIFVTGYRHIAAAMRSNNKFPLFKPFTPKQLQETVELAFETAPFRDPKLS